MLQFTKDDDVFARFASWVIMHAKKHVRKLKQAGVDMKSAIYDGLQHHFPDLCRLLFVLVT